jgi:alpha-ketoglutarate-dependent taurine dioxygenase
MNFIREIDYNEILEGEISSMAGNNKVLVIRNVPEEIDADKFYTGLGNQLGYLFKKDVDPINKKIIDNTWTTIKFDERYIEQTYKHSNKHQPLHTDYCNASIDLDMVLLICKEPAPIGGATVFVDSEKLIYILENFNSDLFERLKNNEVIFGKSPSPIFRNKAKIIDFDSKGAVLHWNYAVIAPDNSAEVLRLCDEFHFFLEEYIFMAGIPEEIYLKKNEAVIMQDRRILHGRNSFWGDRFLLKGGVMSSPSEEKLNYIRKFMQI